MCVRRSYGIIDPNADNKGARGRNDGRLCNVQQCRYSHGRVLRISLIVSGDREGASPRSQSARLLPYRSSGSRKLRGGGGSKDRSRDRERPSPPVYRSRCPHRGVRPPVDTDIGEKRSDYVYVEHDVRHFTPTYGCCNSPAPT